MDDYDSSILLPSDLTGVTVARFRGAIGGNLMTALAPAAFSILDSIRAAIREEHSTRPQAIVEEYSCFISYSAQDRVFAERIHNDLKDVGIRCWLDSKDLKIGDHLEVMRTPSKDKARNS